MLWRRGEIADGEVPPDLLQTARTYDLCHAIPSWTWEQAEEAPAPLANRILTVHRASLRRLSDEEVMDLKAGAIRQRQEAGEQP